MSFREKWIHLQYQILEVLEKETCPFGQEVSGEFAAHLDRYEESLPRHWTPVPLAALVDRAARARVVVVGDHHTHCGGANMVIWLLVELARRGRKCPLFLEALPNGSPREIDAYMTGDLAEETFLERIGYSRVFGFDWNIYRHIIRTAARFGGTVTGINTELAADRLAVRDAFAANVIAGGLLEREPCATPGERGPAIVLVGEKHLAPPHLVQSIAEALSDRGIRGPVVTVHRNVTSAFFERLRGGEYDGAPELLRSSGNRFLALDTSPLAITAKDMHWFGAEHSRLLYPDSGQEGVEPIVLSDFDEPGIFAAVLENMETLLGFDLPNRDDFHIHTGPGLEFLERFRRDGIDPDRYARLLLRATRQETLYVADCGLAWLREIAPALLGNVSALHLSARRGKDCPSSLFLDGVRGALGAALLDPFSAYGPLLPFHPAFDAMPMSSGPPAEKTGAGLGRRIFRNLAAGDLPFDDIVALFEENGAAADAAARRLAG